MKLINSTVLVPSLEKIELFEEKILGWKFDCPTHAFFTSFFSEILNRCATDQIKRLTPELFPVCCP